MSHERFHNHIELQHYHSENGSLSSQLLNGHITPGDSVSRDMSTFGSTVGPGDAVDQPNPTYSSIPEAQTIHQQYKAAQTADDGIAETQYDFISDSHKTAVPHPPGVTMEAMNELYSGVKEEDLPMRHKTLTMTSQHTSQHFKGSLSPEPHDFSKGEGSVGGACRRACVMLVVLVLCVMLVAALAAGVLALTIIFTGFIDICKCDTTNDIAVMNERILALEMMVQELQNSQAPAPTPDDTTEATPTTTTPTPPVTTPELVTTPTTSLLEGVATLTNVNLFQNCSTSVEVTCTVASGDGTGFCFTDPLVPVNRPGEIILNMNCLRTMETEEVNPLIATLEIFDGGAGCICAVPDLDTVARRLHDVECGLQVTRCITPQNITVMIN